MSRNMDCLWRSQLVVVFLWAGHGKAAVLWIFLFLVLSKVNWAQDPSSEVPDCWFYWLHLHSMGQVFWSHRSVQLYRSQRSHYKHGNSAPWMCPPTLTTACKVWPSFTKCKTRNECFFRHQFISWLLKSIWEFGGEIRGFLKSECWRCPEDFFLTEVWVALHCNWSTLKWLYI